MLPDIVIAALIGFIIGMVVGLIIHYYVGEPKCNHQFEEVLRVYIKGKYVVAHMCNKCGKRNITKV